MKNIITLSLIILISYTTSSYNRRKAVNYAFKYLKSPNHKCGSGAYSCTPYGYFGRNACGYKGEGGDCANFVSQCLVEAGHPKLSGGKDYCRGYPCGKEEIGALKLDQCLHNTHKWVRTCGKMQKPPSNIRVGDVAIFYVGGCQTRKAHATIVTSINGGNVKLSGHSPHVKNYPYTYFTKAKKYISWLHYPK